VFLPFQLIYCHFYAYSSRLEDLDDLYYSHEEARNFDNDRTENHVQNVSKLNYHSYMHIQTRANGQNLILTCFTRYSFFNHFGLLFFVSCDLKSSAKIPFSHLFLLMLVPYVFFY
jgi:hypothetical protein